MFRKAYRQASAFTFPVILSRKTHGGCSSSIGAYILLNPDGWIATAGHIILHHQKMASERASSGKIFEDIQKVKDDTSLRPEMRKRKVKGLQKSIPRDVTLECSIWWGVDGARLETVTIDRDVDVAIGKLEGLDTSSTREYPTFKDPSGELEPGTSLCRLGFPFHAITPVWNETTSAFVLPAGAVPVPRFPIDGILTRTIADDSSNSVSIIETSSPGLRGQSGGPIFDVDGVVWALQTCTSHHALGFDPKDPKGNTVHQFLNVGMGAYSATLIRLFDQLGVEYNV